MTPDEVQHLRDLSALATPGPWVVDHAPAVQGFTGDTAAKELIRDSVDRVVANGGWPRDAALIAAMRNHLDDLLAIAERDAAYQAACVEQGLPENCPVDMFIRHHVNNAEAAMFTYKAAAEGWKERAENAEYLASLSPTVATTSKVTDLKAERDAIAEERDRLRAAIETFLAVVDEFDPDPCEIALRAALDERPTP